MFQIISKNNQIVEIDFQPEIDNLIAYSYYPDWLPVPFELYGKNIEVIDGIIIEKPVDLEKLKTQKLVDVEIGYTNAFLNGLNTSVGIKFHIKPEDQLNYIGAMIATQSLQDADVLPLPVIDFNGLTNSITVGASRQAYLEIVNYKAQMEVKRATFLGQIQNAQSPEELELIVINYAEPEA